MGMRKHRNNEFSLHILLKGAELQMVINMLKNCQLEVMQMFKIWLTGYVYPVKMKHKGYFFKCLWYWKMKLLLLLYPRIIILIFPDNLLTDLKLWLYYLYSGVQYIHRKYMKQGKLPRLTFSSENYA